MGSQRILFFFGSIICRLLSYRHLTRETVSTAKVQSNLSELSADTVAEESSILVKNWEYSDVVCARCLKRGNQKANPALKTNTGNK